MQQETIGLIESCGNVHLALPSLFYLFIYLSDIKWGGSGKGTWLKIGECFSGL